MMKESNIINNGQLPENGEQHGYVMNIGMPEFVPRVEIRRLKAVIAQKNAAIDVFKKYDANRKDYVEKIISDNELLKEENAQLEKEIKTLKDKKLVFLYNRQLQAMIEDGDMTKSEYAKFMMMYAYWLEHRNMVNFYKSRLKTGRGSVKDLKADLQSIKQILSNAGDMELLDILADSMMKMTAHLDTLQQRLSSDMD